MKNKILNILLCSVMTLLFTGCVDIFFRNVSHKESIEKPQINDEVYDEIDDVTTTTKNQNSKNSNTLTCSGKLFVYADADEYEVEHTMIVNFDKNNTRVLDFEAIFESSKASIRDMKEVYCEDESEIIKSCEISSEDNKNIITVTYDLDLLDDMTDGEFKKTMTKQQMKEWLLSIPYGEDHICE